MMMPDEMTPEKAAATTNALILDLLQRLSSLTVELLAAAQNTSSAGLDDQERLRLHLDAACSKAFAVKNHAAIAAQEISRILSSFGWHRDCIEFSLGVMKTGEKFEDYVTLEDLMKDRGEEK